LLNNPKYVGFIHKLPPYIEPFIWSPAGWKQPAFFISAVAYYKEGLILQCIFRNDRLAFHCLR